MNAKTLTHEQFIHAVRDIVAARANAQDAAKLRRIKLAYGFGQPGLRGVTIYSRWANGHGPQDPDPFVEICAAGEESIVQLAGTTVRELAHVVAGWGAGHGKEWKETCERLGLRCVLAAGTQYAWAMFETSLRESILALGVPSDGARSTALRRSRSASAAARSVRARPALARVAARRAVQARARGCASTSPAAARSCAPRRTA